MCDEILITPLIGNCELIVARGVGSFSRYRSPSYSAIDLHLIHLIVIISPPYFITLQDTGAFKMLVENWSQEVFVAVCVEVKKKNAQQW